MIPPATAYAASHDYATGQWGVGGTYSRGYDYYDYNQVWHALGKTWSVFYFNIYNEQHGYVKNSTNPTKYPNPGGYTRVMCHNDNDDSGTTWTCQYGQ